jgi:hypothetical protein
MFRGFAISLFFWQAVQGWAPSSSFSVGRRFRSTTTTTKLNSGANDFNVVLRPSDDDESFDNFKIGSAKVHRYSLNTDPDGEIEYVM